MKNIQKGFTLIELMIVVAIIGILAAVAIPAYQDYIVKAKLSRVVSTISPLKDALAGYWQEYGTFPVETILDTTPPTRNMTTANTWDSLGFVSAPTRGAEVSGIQVATGVITLTLQNIKAVDIDGQTIIMTPTPPSALVANSGTGITWTNTCPGVAASVTVFHKFFNC